MKTLQTIIVMLTLVAAAMAATSAPRHDNSLGVVTYVDNPNLYLFGAAIDGSVLHSGRKFATTVRFTPAYTFMLFSQSVLFCGDVSGRFKNGPLVVTYKKIAHEMFEGMACYDLEGVDFIGGNQ